MRHQIVAGNWKMNLSLQQGTELVQAVLEKIGTPKGQVIFAPPFPYLHTVAGLIKGRENVYLAAQNCHQEEKGAFTGEVSADMLLSVGVTHVILGHSERRQYFNETNALLAAKVKHALSKGLRPIFCCGEPLVIREQGNHIPFVAGQLDAGLFDLSEEDFRKVIIAYEPIWAIGTGRTASSDQAQEMHAAIRQLIAGQYGNAVADDSAILYGGSCNAQNAAELFSRPDVDGGLIGGASLKAEDFGVIVESVKGG
jgi:triosephosphate isomerase